MTFTKPLLNRSDNTAGLQHQRGNDRDTKKFSFVPYFVSKYDNLRFAQRRVVFMRNKYSPYFSLHGRHGECMYSCDHVHVLRSRCARTTVPEVPVVEALSHHSATGKLTLILKPIFHKKTGLRWVPDANEIYTKNMKCTCSTRKCCVGTQRNLYSTGNF